MHLYAYIKNNNDHTKSDIGITVRVCVRLATSISLIKHKENLPKIATYARTSEYVFVFVEFFAAPHREIRMILLEHQPVRKKIAPRVELTCTCVYSFIT